MKNALITGGTGFVGKHLARLLLDNGYSVSAIGNDESVEAMKGGFAKYGDNLLCIWSDITSYESIHRIISDIKPGFIFHLAAQSSVGLSWINPSLTYRTNIESTVNLLESIKVQAGGGSLSIYSPKVLIVGSSEEYGKIQPEDLPVNEEAATNPSSHYAISKMAQERAALLYCDTSDIDVTLVRAFNHIGPGQSPTFVVSDFTKQIAEIEKGLMPPTIYVGNLEAKRDFTDVRDIVNGYYQLAKSGGKGHIYNIGSGKSVGVKYILDTAISFATCKIDIEIDKRKFRPIDVSDIYADITKICRDTGWSPKIPIEKSIEDSLNYWRETL